MATLTPYPLYADVAAALGWLRDTFGFDEVLRYGAVDPEGHGWFFATPVRDVGPQGWGAVGTDG